MLKIKNSNACSSPWHLVEQQALEMLGEWCKPAVDTIPKYISSSLQDVLDLSPEVKRLSFDKGNLGCKAAVRGEASPRCCSWQCTSDWGVTFVFVK